MFPTVHHPERPSSTEAVRVDVLLAGMGGGGDGSLPTKKRQRGSGFLFGMRVWLAL
jgi:hypothetical protein